MCIHPVADECPSGAPYAIIVEGDGVSEVKLGYGRGSPVARMVTVEKSRVDGTHRVVVLTRKLRGLTSAGRLSCGGESLHVL